MMDRSRLGLCVPVLAAAFLLSACGGGSGTTEVTAPPPGHSEPAGSEKAGQVEKPAGARGDRPEVEKPEKENSKSARGSGRDPRTSEDRSPPAAEQPVPAREPAGPCAEDPGSRECEESRDPDPPAPASGSQRQFHGDEPVPGPPACTAGECDEPDSHP
jgi:hypothetical protein